MSENKTDGEYTVGEFWLSKKPDRKNWQITWYNTENGGNRYASTGTRDLQKAKIKINEYFINHGKIEDKTGDILIVDILLRYYHKHALINTKRPDVIRYSLGYWSEYFESNCLSFINTEEIDRFISHLRDQGKSNGTINRILCDGRSAINRAYRNGEIATCPFIKSLPKGEPYKYRPSPRQVAQFIEAIDTDRMFRYVMIRLCTACRGDAALDLTIHQLRFRDNLIELNPAGRQQTKKFRPIIPMAPTLRFWLEKWQDCEYLVNYKNDRIKSNKKAFAATRERAGLPRQLIGKTFRHLIATELRRQRVDRWEVSGLLGHSTGSTTDDYAVYDPSYLSQAIEAIENFLVEIQGYCKKQILSDEVISSISVPEVSKFKKTGMYRIK